MVLFIRTNQYKVQKHYFQQIALEGSSVEKRSLYIPHIVLRPWSKITEFVSKFESRKCRV